MPIPILYSKLYIPPLRSKIVVRPRLIEKLNTGLRNSNLTLISAPAGSGKTTLLSKWIANCNYQITWLSLDEADNDLSRFLAHFIAALQKIEGSQFTVTDIGDEGQGMLQPYNSMPSELLLSTLINEITDIPEPFILVLDDYHVINTESVEHILFFLLEHLPPQMHLVIASRKDPDLPLAKLRVRNQLTELRATDLRFTADEASEFLNHVMGLHLSGNDVATLETRTEGWIAGLQLAALSMQGKTDTSSFIHAFAGSHRFVLDYLVEEVLQYQPDYVSQFLLQTAILDKLNASLCDAVTRREDSKSMLGVLESRNLFTLPLDDKRQWYRYHHLFADVLRSHVTEKNPEQIPGLHHRASIWYEKNNMLPDAIHHAFAAQNFERAADLLEYVWAEMDINLQSAVWSKWVKRLPDKLFSVRPVLSVAYAWALLESGEVDNCETRLKDAERWFDDKEILENDKMIVVDEEQFRSLPATIATAHAYCALVLGNAADTLQYAQKAFNLTPVEDYVRHIQANTLLALALYASGKLAAATRTLINILTNEQTSDHILTRIGIAFILAEIREVQGQLQGAMHTYQQALQQVEGRNTPTPVGVPDLYRGISELYCERNELETASQYLLTSKKLSEQALLIGGQHRLYIAESRLMAAQGNLDGAISLLNDAERSYIRGALPDIQPIAALRTKLWLAQGKLTEALMWVHEQELSPDDSLSFTNEFDYITLSRVFIARYRVEQTNDAIHEALKLLERLLFSAEEGGRTGRIIEILVLQALAHEAQGNVPNALIPLERALTLAQPEGYIRVFVNEGAPIVALLHQAEKHNISPDYVRKLLLASRQTVDTTPAKQPLSEPLSERELAVLALLKTDLTGPKIADELMIAMSTMRTHTQNIYNKLGVNNRRAAVRRAEELDL